MIEGGSSRLVRWHLTVSGNEVHVFEPIISAVGLLVVLYAKIDVFFSGEHYGTKCSQDLVANIESPAGDWRLIVTEELCESRFVSSVTGGVFVQRADMVNGPVMILGTNVNGSGDSMPRVAWAAPDRAVVTLRYGTGLLVRRRSVPGLTIDIHLDSQDSAQQDAFRKALDAADKQPAASPPPQR
jgi:hypothetical protein